VKIRLRGFFALAINGELWLASYFVLSASCKDTLVAVGYEATRVIVSGLDVAERRNGHPCCESTSVDPAIINDVIP
jgi:hypothetical protein